MLCTYMSVTIALYCLGPNVWGGAIKKYIFRPTWCAVYSLVLPCLFMSCLLNFWLLLMYQWKMGVNSSICCHFMLECTLDYCGFCKKMKLFHSMCTSVLKSMGSYVIKSKFDLWVCKFYAHSRSGCWDHGWV